MRAAVLPVDIPEGNGISLIREAVLGKAESLDPLLHVFAVDARRHHSRDVALHVGKEHRNSHIAECFSHDPQSHRLTCSGSACDQSVPVSLSRKKKDIFAVFVHSQPYFTILIHFVTPIYSANNASPANDYTIFK